MDEIVQIKLKELEEEKIEMKKMMDILTKEMSEKDALIKRHERII